jgi:HRDC domain
MSRTSKASRHAREADRRRGAAARLGPTPAVGAPPRLSPQDDADDVRTRLDAWCSRTAHGLGWSEYVILKRAELLAIVARRPRTVEELGAIRGIGPAKIRRWAGPILALVAGASPGDVVPPPPPRQPVTEAPAGPELDPERAISSRDDRRSWLRSACGGGWHDDRLRSLVALNDPDAMAAALDSHRDVASWPDDRRRRSVAIWLALIDRRRSVGIMAGPDAGLAREVTGKGTPVTARQVTQLREWARSVGLLIAVNPPGEYPADVIPTPGFRAAMTAEQLDALDEWTDGHEVELGIVIDWLDLASGLDPAEPDTMDRLPAALAELAGMLTRPPAPHDDTWTRLVRERSSYPGRMEIMQ